MTDPRLGLLIVTIEQARERAGLSQRELAKRAGWEHSALSKLESGQRVRLPAEESLKRLDDALGEDGRLMRIAGYDGAPAGDVDDAIKELVDGAVDDLVAKIRQALGR